MQAMLTERVFPSDVRNGFTTRSMILKSWECKTYTVKRPRGLRCTLSPLDLYKYQRYHGMSDLVVKLIQSYGYGH